MRRSKLEHIIRAAGSITGDPEIVILGSQALLGQYPDAPEERLLRLLESLPVADPQKQRISKLIHRDFGTGESH